MTAVEYSSFKIVIGMVRDEMYLAGSIKPGPVGLVIEFVGRLITFRYISQRILAKLSIFRFPPITFELVYFN